MGNRASPGAVVQVYFDEWLARERPDLVGKVPPCQCEGQPHTRDSATILRKIGYGIKGSVREATRRGGVESGHLILILHAVQSWNLVLEDGEKRPLDVQEVGLLDDLTVQWLLDDLDPAWEDEPLPNASSAPSPDGSRGSAGPTQTTPTETEEQPPSTST